MFPAAMTPAGRSANAADVWIKNAMKSFAEGSRRDQCMVPVLMAAMTVSDGACCATPQLSDPFAEHDQLIKDGIWHWMKNPSVMAEHAGRTFSECVTKSWKAGHSMQPCPVTTASMPDEEKYQALMKRSIVPPAESILMAHAVGSYKAFCATKATKPAWPFATPTMIRQLSDACREAGDPNMQKLADNQFTEGLFIAQVISRLFASHKQSQSSLGRVAFGENWVAVRFPNPPPLFAKDTQKKLNIRKSFAIFRQNEWNTEQPYSGYLPQPHGWHKVTDKYLWKVFEVEDYELESMIARPSKSIVICHSLMNGRPSLTDQVPTGGGPLKNCLAGNLLLIACTFEKRCFQDVLDAVGYCTRAAGSSGTSVSNLIKDTYTSFCEHPWAGLTLGFGAQYCGTCKGSPLMMQAVMSAIKSAGTNKESNAVNNKRGTTAAVAAHASHALAITTHMVPL